MACRKATLVTLVDFNDVESGYTHALIDLPLNQSAAKIITKKLFTKIIFRGN